MTKRKAEVEVEVEESEVEEESGSEVEESGSEVEEEETTGGFKSKGKKAAPAKKKGGKDLVQPKRPLTAYIFFTQAERANVAEELGEGVAQTEIMRELGARWKALDDEEKAPYEKLNKKDKVRFEKEKAAFEKAGGVFTKKKKGSPSPKKAKKGAKGKGKGKGKAAIPRKKKDPTEPTKPKSASEYYFLERFETEGVEGGDWHDITKKEAREAAMEEWKEMTKEEKQPYSDKRKEMAQQYEIDHAAWEKKQKKAKAAAAAEEDEEEEEEDEEEGEEEEEEEEEGEGGEEGEGEGEEMEVTEDEA